MRDSVRIEHCLLSSWTLDISAKGHPTEVIEACREIAQAIIRGRNRWWFQEIHGELGDNEELVGDIHFEVMIKFGD